MRRWRNPATIAFFCASQTYVRLRRRRPSKPIAPTQSTQIPGSGTVAAPDAPASNASANAALNCAPNCSADYGGAVGLNKPPSVVTSALSQEPEESKSPKYH